MFKVFGFLTKRKISRHSLPLRRGDCAGSDRAAFLAWSAAVGTGAGGDEVGADELRFRDPATRDIRVNRKGKLDSDHVPTPQRQE